MAITRIWAPFSGKGGLPYDPERVSTWQRQETFYCHGYRQPGEHYHKTEQELRDCSLPFPRNTEGSSHVTA